jgi:lysozyme family protein
MSAPAFGTLQAYYAERWQRMVIPEHYASEVSSVAHRIHANKTRYLTVSKTTGVPWWFIGCVHYREGNCNFSTHLHNGDPLSRRTRNVPAGRPSKGNPPFTWEASATDALEMRGLHKVSINSVERASYEWEGYNGWGYHYKGVPSSYLWAHSAQHIKDHDSESKGKYVADHNYDPNAIDKEVGTMPLLKALLVIDPSIAVDLGLQKASAPASPPAPVAPAPTVPVHTPTPKAAPEAPKAPLWVSLLKVAANLLITILKAH